MSRYIYHQGLIIRGIHTNIKGLCVLQETRVDSLFFIPEDNYQRDGNFFNFKDFTNIADEEIEHLINLYGEDTKGRWIDDRDITWMNIDLTLFSFITSSELTLKQILSNLQQEIIPLPPSNTAASNDRELGLY